MTDLSNKVARRFLFAEDVDHQKSIELMKFLSGVAKRLGIGDHVYVVGGAVRDFVIDRPIKDIDVVIDAVALEGKDSDWFAKKLQKAIPAKTSLQTNQYGVAILTVNGSWNLGSNDLKGEVIEIANAREESYGGEGGKGYKPSEVTPSTIEKDVNRRELTFNTLMWQLSQLADGPEKAEIIDLTGCGLDDLEQGVMKCPSDPDKTFSDDPTRMLRVVKYLLRYGFDIHPIVEKSIRRNADKIKKAPQNAISEILINDILSMQQSKKTLVELKELGLLDPIGDMIRENKAFRQTLINWANRDADILFLFDLVDMGLPLRTKVHFLDKDQQEKLRQVALNMEKDQAYKFVDLLKQPGKVLNTKALIDRFDLQGPEIGSLMELATEALLQEPSLARNPRALTREVASLYQSI